MGSNTFTSGIQDKIQRMSSLRPVVSRRISTRPVTEDDLMRLLTEPQNSITRQYEKLMLLEGASLRFEDEAKREMARIAAARGTGARGLRAILEDVILEVMFDAVPGSSVTITKAMVAACEGPDKAA